MVVVSYSGKEINAKLVYYGAGLSGKTTNLEAIYEAVPESSRGKMVSMKTQSDRTLFFDLLPLDLGEIMGYKTRFLLYTVPGQVFYNATRKLVLKGADAIVFVVDSGIGKMEENKDSLANLRANLGDYGVRLDDIPFVLQYNKRDLPNVYSVEELNAELNPDAKIQVFEAVATQGIGVFETFRGVSHLLMQKVTREIRRSPHGSPPARAARAEESDARAAESPVAAGAGPDSQWVGRAEATLPTPPVEVDQAPPMAPARVMAQEARVAEPGEEEPPIALEYGRQVTLGDVDESNEERPEPQPPVITSSRGDQRPRDGERARTSGRDAARERAPATAKPERRETGPAAGLVERTLAFEAQPPAAELPEEVVVPVTVPRGASREIVIRIVIQGGG